MKYILLVMIGLCLGSFVNALVWRVHEQAKVTGKSSKRPRKQLSITNGRSMCPECKHELAAKDLIPVLSWIGLGGKCRYCRMPISTQYPLVELVTAGLFVASYLWWPREMHGAEWLAFGVWLLILVGLMALTVYDLRWMLLPNRIMLPVGVLATLFALASIFMNGNVLSDIINTLLAVAVGGGIFYALYQLSGGKWIGGGDVKLGWVLGLLLATPANSLLMIFIASIAGSVVSLPLLARGRVKRTSVIPFGPFLILGAVVVVLFGANIIDWYQEVVLLSA